MREIAWREIFPWLGLVRSARVAAAPRMLLLATVGLVLTLCGLPTAGTGRFRLAPGSPLVSGGLVEVLHDDSPALSRALRICPKPNLPNSYSLSWNSPIYDPVR